MSETKQARLRKLEYRSRHRGIREMDIVFGRFAEHVLVFFMRLCDVSCAWF